MIKYRFVEKDGRFEYTATGHSGQATRGKDLVCAAVSILSYTLVESIDKSLLEEDPYIVLSPGTAVISLKAAKGKEGELRGVFSVIRNGFSLLDENFPKNIKKI